MCSKWSSDVAAGGARGVVRTLVPMGSLQLDPSQTRVAQNYRCYLNLLDVVCVLPLSFGSVSILIVVSDLVVGIFVDYCWSLLVLAGGGCWLATHADSHLATGRCFSPERVNHRRITRLLLWETQTATAAAHSNSRSSWCDHWCGEPSTSNVPRHAGCWLGGRSL